MAADEGMAVDFYRHERLEFIPRRFTTAIRELIKSKSRGAVWVIESAGEFIGYAVVYTVWLKPRTPQNIVIGGGAGAAPATTTTGTGVLTALGVNTGTAGAYSYANSTPAITTDAYGRVSGITPTLIQLDTSQIISGTLPVVRGGTGASSFAIKGVIVSDTSSTTGALVVPNNGGLGVTGNVFFGNAVTIDASQTANQDTIIKGKTDGTLVWARPGASYDQVVIGGSATTSTAWQPAPWIIGWSIATTAMRPPAPYACAWCTPRWKTAWSATCRRR